MARRTSSEGYTVERTIKVMVEPGYWHFVCPGCGMEITNQKAQVWAPPKEARCKSCQTLTNFGHFHRGLTLNLVKTEEQFGKIFSFKALVTIGQ